MKTSTIRTVIALIVGLLCSPAWGQLPTLGAGPNLLGGVLSEPLTANRLIQKSSPTYLLPQVWPVNTRVGGARYLELAAGYWPLTTDANDTTGNGNNGTAVNGPLTYAQGAGVTLNGSNQSITIPAAASLNFGGKQLTVAAWVNPTANGGSHSNAVAASRSGCTGANINWQLYSFLRSGVDGGINMPAFAAALSQVNGSSALPLNKPSLLAGTYDGANITLSVGGVQNGTPVADTSGIASNNATLTVGLDGGCTSNFAGTIGKLRVQKFALPLSVLAALSAAGPTSLAWNDDRNWTDNYPLSQLIVVSRGDEEPPSLRRMMGG